MEHFWIPGGLAVFPGLKGRTNWSLFFFFFYLLALIMSRDTVRSAIHRPPWARRLTRIVFSCQLCWLSQVFFKIICRTTANQACFVAQTLSVGRQSNSKIYSKFKHFKQSATRRFFWPIATEAPGTPSHVSGVKMKNRKRRGPMLLQLDWTQWSFNIFDRLKTRKKKDKPTAKSYGNPLANHRRCCFIFVLISHLYLS